MQLPLVAFGAMGLGNHTKHSWVEHAWSWWAAGPSPVLPPVLQAFLTFPLVEAEWWFCAPSSSRLRHWEPSCRTVLGRRSRCGHSVPECTRGAQVPPQLLPQSWSLRVTAPQLARWSLRAGLLRRGAFMPLSQWWLSETAS
jgi:hypothetical protein